MASKLAPAHKKPLRDVVKSEYCGACRYTRYIDRSIRLTLSCGHESYRKASQGIPKRAGCYECMMDLGRITEEAPHD